MKASPDYPDGDAVGEQGAELPLRLAISRLHFPIMALGPGKRIGLWVQGCSIRCPGCMSRDTWAFAPDGMELDALINMVTPWLKIADGITISGGEPFDQAPALAALLRRLRRCFAGDVLVYSGYSFEAIQRLHPDVLPQIDVLISEPYDPLRATDLPLRGSDNQRIHLLSAMGADRFCAIANAEVAEARSAIDVVIDPSGEAWIAGVPRPGDLERLGGVLAQQGIAIASSAGRMGSPR